MHAGHREVIEWLLESTDGPQIRNQFESVDKQGRTTVEELREKRTHLELADLIEEFHRKLIEGAK